MNFIKPGTNRQCVRCHKQIRKDHTMILTNAKNAFHLTCWSPIVNKADCTCIGCRGSIYSGDQVFWIAGWGNICPVCASSNTLHFKFYN